jgi:hypothetical protein
VSRLLRAVVLSLLLTGTQYGAQLHALGHIGEALRQPVNHSIGAPEDEACVLCVLFAGGANALHNEIPTCVPASIARDDPRCAPVFVARAAPHFYYSRAPPAFL